jgi:uncharacterized membrane protein
MFELLIGAVVGALVGWSIPQPAWAAAIVAWIKSKI